MHFRSIYFEIKGMYTITYSIKNMKRYILFIAQVVQFDDYINMCMCLCIIFNKSFKNFSTSVSPYERDEEILTTAEASGKRMM